MMCPYCHAENKDDALACDFCLRELPITKERAERIKQINKQKRHNTYKNSMVKLIGTVLGVLAIVAVIVIAWIKTRG